MQQNRSNSALLWVIILLLTLTYSACNRPIEVLKIKQKIGDFSFDYDHSERYQTGSFATTALVKEIDIDWIDGTVEVVATDSDSLSVSETADKALSDTTKVHWYLDDEATLHIEMGKACRNVKNQAFDGLNKHLVVRVPRKMNIEDLDYNGVGCRLLLDDVRCNEMTFDGVNLNLIATLNQAPNEITLEGVNIVADITLPKGTQVMGDIEGANCYLRNENSGKAATGPHCHVQFNGVDGKVDIHAQ